jgi:hypothetical protein
MESKPLLVGESNPYGSDPRFALYPAPDGCSGHRLCCLVLGMRRADYLREFERKNLCDGPWDMLAARRRAQELRTWKAPIILLGAKVARAFEFDPFEPFVVTDGGRTLVLPHPSGRCRVWNDPLAVGRTRALVAEVVPQVAHLLDIANAEGNE